MIKNGLAGNLQSPNSTNEGKWVYRIVLGGHGVHCTRGLYAVLLQGVQHAEDTDPMPVFPMGQPGVVREVPGAQTAGERRGEADGDPMPVGPLADALLGNNLSPSLSEMDMMSEV